MVPFGGAPFGGAAFGASGVEPVVATASDTLALTAAMGDHTYHPLRDYVLLTDALSGPRSNALKDRVALAASVFASTQFRVLAADTATFATAIHIAYTALMEDEAALTDDVLPAVESLQRAVDTLVLTGVVSSRLQANAALATAVVLNASVSPSWLASLVDQADFVDSVLQTMTAISAALDEVELTEEVVGTLRMVLYVSDQAALDDEASLRGTFIQYLEDGVVLRALMTLAGQQYSVWVMSPDNEAVYQYEDFHFNSFVKFANHYYGANDSGLFLLEGDDDAGEPIAARVRSGLLDFGTGRLKQMSRAYLGYTATGALLLKVVTIADRGPTRGQKVEDWYELTRTHSQMAEGRIPVGEGLKSVYWQFTLHNKAGADFSTDEIKLYPLLSDRRIK